MSANSSALFTTTTIGKLEFKNRLLRSSIGGRTAYYDGTVNDAWETFERRFASGGVAGIISATLTVDDQRWSPLEYPAISHERYVRPLAEKIGRLKRDFNCRYIIQVGDPGYATQTSLFRQKADALTATSGIDPLYGYLSLRREMSAGDIKKVVDNFGSAAVRVKSTGCDGIELTASKGYMIHQFLNPGTNRRNDQYGGSLQNRFRILERSRRDDSQPRGIGFPVRGAAVVARLQPQSVAGAPALRTWLVAIGADGRQRSRRHAAGGQWLQDLGVDYLHISSGFGFINPTRESRTIPDSGSEDVLRLDAAARVQVEASLDACFICSRMPSRTLCSTSGGRNRTRRASTCSRISTMRGHSSSVSASPSSSTPGFSGAAFQQGAGDTACDMVSMARPLLANPHLPRLAGRGHHAQAGARMHVLQPVCSADDVISARVLRAERDSRLAGMASVRSDDEVREFMERQIERFNRPKQRPTPQAPRDAGRTRLWPEPDRQRAAGLHSRPGQTPDISWCQRNPLRASDAKNGPHPIDGPPVQARGPYQESLVRRACSATRSSVQATRPIRCSTSWRARRLAIALRSTNCSCVRSR